MKFLLKLIFVLSIFNPYTGFAQFTGNSKKQKFPTIDIPDGLLFGAGTSAVQAEGALNSHGRTTSATEQFLSKITLPVQRPLDSPEISSDSYHRYKEDVKILKFIGLDLYRFSMSWTRLLPTGYVDHVNQEGVDYYHALLDELEEAGIEPMVELNHFDHPASFANFGGWHNESIVEIFKDYAGFVFNEFGHRVKYFLTFNEPSVLCNFLDSEILNYDETIKSTFSRTFICSHNILKAHAEAYHLYHDKFNLDGKGAISINLLCNDFIIEEEKNRHLLDIAFAFGCGWFADPIFSATGDYSDILKRRVNESAALRDNKNGLLPTFSQSWIEKIRGTADFFGVSYYTSRIVDQANDYKSSLNFFLPAEAQLILKNVTTWLPTRSDNYIVPSGLRTVLKKIKENYNNPAIHIIENGFADDGRLFDTDRIKYIYAHLKQAIDAINYDQCDVRSYVYWSLIDNFEFWYGYSTPFGLAHVDFNSPNRTRTLKESAHWLRNVLRTRRLYIGE